MIRASEANFASERSKRNLRKPSKGKQTAANLANKRADQAILTGELRERVSLAQSSQIKKISHGPSERSELHERVSLAQSSQITQSKHSKVRNQIKAKPRQLKPNQDK